MKKCGVWVLFLTYFCTFHSAQETKLSTDSSALQEPAHLLSVVVLHIGKSGERGEAEKRIHELNCTLDYPRVSGYQPLRLRLDHFESYTLKALNEILLKQCAEAEPLKKEDFENGHLSQLRSLRFTAYPDSLMIYSFPLEVNDFFREQSMEPLKSNETADPTLSLGACKEAYENDYCVLSSNWTLLRSFGRYFQLPDAWDEDSNKGLSLDDVAKNGSWEEGKVDSRPGRANAMDRAESPYAFTLSQLKHLYTSFLDRQTEDTPLKEEKGKAFYLSQEDLHQLGKQYVKYEDYEKALKCFKSAADQGYLNSWYWMGYLHDQNLCENSTKKLTLECYQKAADGGVALAQYRLGVMYEYGYGKISPSIEKAQKYWQMAADQGNEEAKDKLEIYQGMKPIKASEVNACYSRGMHAYYDGDSVEAFKCFYLCSLHQHKNALYFLGLCYYQGKGVPKNLVKAREIWDRISDFPQAQNALGMLYFYGGEGVEKDLETSYEWFTKADKNGYEGAQQWLQKFNRVLDEGEEGEGETFDLKEPATAEKGHEEECADHEKKE